MSGNYFRRLTEAKARDAKKAMEGMKNPLTGLVEQKTWQGDLLEGAEQEAAKIAEEVVDKVVEAVDEAPGKTMDDIEKEMQEAIKNEDFVKAAELKMERTKLQEEAAEKLKALKEASRAAHGTLDKTTGMVHRKTWVGDVNPLKAQQKQAQVRFQQDEGKEEEKPSPAKKKKKERPPSAFPVAIPTPVRDKTAGVNMATGMVHRKTWVDPKELKKVAEADAGATTTATKLEGMEGFPETGVILVTGASRGIGLAICKLLALKFPAWQLIAAVRDPESAQVKNTLKKFYITKNDIVVKMDIDDEKSVQDCFDHVKKSYGKIDILVNNAGIATKNHPVDPILKIDPEDFMKVMRVNVIGTWRVTTKFMPLLEAADEPKVINLSSDLGSITNNKNDNAIGQMAGGKASYRAAKAALNMMTRTFAVECPNIAFIAMSPGWVDTDMGGSAGRKPPLKPDESAKRLLRMINEFSMEHTGKFWTAKYAERENWEISF